MNLETVQYDTMQGNTVQHNTITIQYNTTQHSCNTYNTIQHNTITTQYNTTQHNTIHTRQYNTTQLQYNPIPHYTSWPVYTKIQYLRLETDGSDFFENRCTRCICHCKLNRFQKLQIRYSVYQTKKNRTKKLRLNTRIIGVKV